MNPYVNVAMAYPDRNTFGHGMPPLHCRGRYWAEGEPHV